MSLRPFGQLSEAGQARRLRPLAQVALADYDLMACVALGREPATEL